MKVTGGKADARAVNDLAKRTLGIEQAVSAAVKCYPWTAI